MNTVQQARASHKTYRTWLTDFSDAVSRFFLPCLSVLFPHECVLIIQTYPLTTTSHTVIRFYTGKPTTSLLTKTWKWCIRILLWDFLHPGFSSASVRGQKPCCVLSTPQLPLKPLIRWEYSWSTAGWRCSLTSLSLSAEDSRESHSSRRWTLPDGTSFRLNHCSHKTESSLKVHPVWFPRAWTGRQERGRSERITRRHKGRVTC